MFNRTVETCLPSASALVVTVISALRAAVVLLSADGRVPGIPGRNLPGLPLQVAVSC